MAKPAVRNLIRAILLTAALPMTAVAAAPADVPGADAAIAARQTGFKKMGGAMKALKLELQNPVPAASVMIESATTIAEAAAGQGKLFPAGSGISATLKTAALPAIWTDRATFDTQMATLVTESARLAVAAKAGDVAAIKAQQASTGAACGACHRQFRAES
ncbi:cytochrome c [Novosphingobium sp.]|uniref:c-type cytochrome n=1 Tax=Novosphingobium sp. TaxID=1874826 RepID=UPI0025F8F388|nr:cytochrome c [Novosphingobium sp.]